MRESKRIIGWPIQNTRHRLIPVFLAIALLGSLILGIHCIDGVEIGYDSMFYLTSAESLMTGKGLRWIGGGGSLNPLTHYPPAYPIILAGMGKLGFNLESVATGLNIFLFGLSGVLCAALIYSATRSIICSITASLLYFLTPGVLDVHLVAQTEPIFLTLLLGFFLSINAFCNQPGKGTVLLLGAVCLLGYMSRYIGSTMILPGAIWILFSKKGKRNRWSHLGIFLLVTLLPIFLWGFRNFQLTGSFTNRVFAFHPSTFDKLKEGFSTISLWFLPSSINIKHRMIIILSGLLPFGVAFIRWLWTRGSIRKIAQDIREKDSAFAFLGSLFLYAVIYIAALGFSLTFFDSSTRLNNRILVPVWVILLVFLVVGIHQFRGALKLYAGGIAFVLIVFNAHRSFPLLRNFQQEGGGFNGLEWRTSETISMVEELNPVSSIYSTEASAVYYLTRLPAYWVPEKVDPVKQQIRSEYEDQLSEMRARLSEPDSYLVVFWGSLKREELPPLVEMTEGLMILYEGEDGGIYGN